MDVITTAIVSALANQSKDAVKDLYNGLKGALKNKFGSESDLVEAVDKLEKNPDREDRQATVKTEVEIAKVNDDQDLVKLARDLLEKIQQQLDSSKSIIIGDVQATGEGSLAMGSFEGEGGVAIANFEGEAGSIGGIHGKK